MPFCPNCKAEYQDGTIRCAVCGISLADKVSENPEADLPVYLTTASTSFEANYTESYLKENGIPVLKIHHGAGAYVEMVMGNACTGIDLYVSAGDFEKASELIQAISTPAEIPEEIDVSEQESESPRPTGHIVKFFFGFLLLFILLFYLFLKK